MIQSVTEYLRLLKQELSGCDPATIQDALADAEEYLRDALANDGAGVPEADPLAPIVEEFGLPEEIAGAYKKIQARIPSALAPGAKARPSARSPLARFFGILADPAAWGALVYLLLSLVTGVLYFSWGVTGLSTSAGLIILIIGLPFLVLFLLSVRGIALVEGRIVEALLGVRMPRRPLFVDKNLSWWERFKGLLFSRHTWMSLLYMLIMLPLGVIYFSLFVTLLALSLGLIVAPIVEIFSIGTFMTWGDANYVLPKAWLPLLVVGGILILTLTMHLAKITGRFQGWLAKSMLVG